jgi:hypothetical protein
MYETTLASPISNRHEAGEALWPRPLADSPANRGGAHILRFDAASLAAVSQSPSLARPVRGSEPAREMKLLLSESQAREVELRLGPLLTLDPHADPAQGNSYRLSILYCDTPKLDVMHRRGRYRLFKFRVRRYGESNQIYLERKSKRGTQVRKRRAAIEMAELACFHEASPPQSWAGSWYHRQVRRNQFSPVCLIQYERVAYFGACGTGPIRLTFDRKVRGTLRADWSLAEPPDSTLLMPDMVVCEFKFRAALPALFKSVLQVLQLTPQGASKYRACLRTCGQAEKGTSADA